MNDFDSSMEHALSQVAREVEHERPAALAVLQSRARTIVATRKRVRVAVGCIAVVVVMLAAVGIRSASSRPADFAADTTFNALSRNGLTVEVPAGWFVQPEAPKGTNPVLVFLLGNRDVGTSAYCDDRGFTDPRPTDLMPTDVIVQIRERLLDNGAPSAPPVGPRPAELDASTMDAAMPCHNADATYYRTRFTDGGRQFDLFFIVGNRATAESVRLGWEVLNRFSVE